MKSLPLILSLLFFKSIYSFEEDKVESIPDYSYNGTLFSGYLNVSEVKKFHYMFNFAEEDHENKPLVLWLNGGPGCSSIDGWANEHGPMYLDDEGKFHINNYSWVKSANMLYLESPGDVGFSYINSTDKEDLYIDDNTTAVDNLNAILDFFRKFPDWKDNDFYITGESYGGTYVPILAYKVLEYNKGVEDSKKINLKGIIVGNGLADWKYDYKPAIMDFVFTHHIISYETRLEYVKYCLKNATYDKTKCDDLQNSIFNFLEGINKYDYLRECKMPPNLKGENGVNSGYYQRAPWAFERSEKTKEELREIKVTEEEEGSQVTPCFDDTKFEAFFNRPDVQKALHVTAKRTWYVCSGPVYDRYNHTRQGSVWAYPYLIEAKLRILLYAGDTDIMVPYNGNQMWIKNLNLNIVEPWRSWRAYGDKNNIAGYVVKYEGLTFCTIKGTGHMPPRWKPKETYYMFSKFLNGTDF